MDISIGWVVKLVVYMLVAAGVFALLFFLIDYVARKFPGETTDLFAKFAKVFLVVCGVLILISILLSFIGVIPPINVTK